MSISRRQTLSLGLTALTAVGLSPLMSRPGFAQMAAEGQNTYPTDSGEIVIHPVSHASMVMETPDMVIYVDPVGGASAYEGMPDPDLVLITHEHGDHYDPETLAALVGENTQLITNPAVHDMLPEDLKARASAMANGDSMTVGAMSIDAIPAYNTTEDRLEYHPEGRDNGYILGIDGTRVYIAGDTEDTEEMRALEDIDIAFLPMNLPYTMDVEQAAAAVGAFAPGHVYPYHYRGSDIDAFEAGVADEDVDTQVMRGNWYPGGA